MHQEQFRGIRNIAVAGNRSAYYWLLLQIVFAVIGSISSLPIAFTAHIGGFIAGVDNLDYNVSAHGAVKITTLFDSNIPSSFSHFITSRPLNSGMAKSSKVGSNFSR